MRASQLTGALGHWVAASIFSLPIAILVHPHFTSLGGRATPLASSSGPRQCSTSPDGHPSCNLDPVIQSLPWAKNSCGFVITLGPGVSFSEQKWKNLHPPLGPEMQELLSSRRVRARPKCKDTLSSEHNEEDNIVLSTQDPSITLWAFLRIIDISKTNKEDDSTVSVSS